MRLGRLILCQVGASRVRLRMASKLPTPFRLRLLGPILGRCVPSRCNARIVFSITWKFNVNTIHANPVGRCPSSGAGGQNRFPIRVNLGLGWLRRGSLLESIMGNCQAEENALYTTAAVASGPGHAQAIALIRAAVEQLKAHLTAKMLASPPATPLNNSTRGS